MQKYELPDFPVRFDNGLGAGNILEIRNVSGF